MRTMYLVRIISRPRLRTILFSYTLPGSIYVPLLYLPFLTRKPLPFLVINPSKISPRSYTAFAHQENGEVGGNVDAGESGKCGTSPRPRFSSYPQEYDT